MMISVCMATYNGEKYIKEQLDSILIQLKKDDEVIISDDGSTDNTLSIIESYRDNRIKLYKFNGHCYTANFENALKQSKGDYIFLSDQDDVWMPNKIETCLEYLKKYDFIMTNAKIVDKYGKVICESRNEMLNVRRGFWNNLLKTKYLGCCFAFSRKVLNRSLPFPNNKKLCLHDAWIMCIAEKFYKTAIIETPLILYRRHDNNISSGSLLKKLNVIKSIKIRLYLIFNILRRKRL